VITPKEMLAKAGVRVYGPEEAVDAHAKPQFIPRVSGSLKAHYAPTTPLRLYAPGRVLDALTEFPDTKSRVAVAVWDSESSLGDDGHPSAQFVEVGVPSDSSAFASRLYRTLRDLDEQGWDLILFPEPPAGEEWDGVRDRLQRACFGSGPSSSNHASN
jgi:L-threonylcarbamoyladenylate synthase